MKELRWRQFCGEIRASQNCLQTYLPLTPEQQKDQNLFRMHPGIGAALENFERFFFIEIHFQ